MISFSVVPYELVDEAAHDSDYTSDYNSDIDEEEAIFNRIFKLLNIYVMCD